MQPFLVEQRQLTELLFWVAEEEEEEEEEKEVQAAGQLFLAQLAAGVAACWKRPYWKRQLCWGGLPNRSFNCSANCGFYKVHSPSDIISCTELEIVGWEIVKLLMGSVVKFLSLVECCIIIPPTLPLVKLFLKLYKFGPGALIHDDVRSLILSVNRARVQRGL